MVFGKATASQIRDLSKQDDIFGLSIIHRWNIICKIPQSNQCGRNLANSNINENEQVIADQANQHTYIDGTGVAAVIIDTGVDAGHLILITMKAKPFLTNLIELLELG
ncbi:MAG: hypothetical protein CM15mP42_05900 [Methanobacteriota archaeon]|nr:MAG: hypothetical protein CM15mP42_05900 [Euryarchaeota archaeon]